MTEIAFPLVVLYTDRECLEIALTGGDPMQDESWSRGNPWRAV